MPTIAPGVDFDYIAREWRCKWSEENDKKSLVDAQKALLEIMPKVSVVKGIKVQRMVCGSCHDYKVICSLAADKFGDWEKESFAPESEFLEALKGISGITSIETQTITTMPVKVTPPLKLKKAKFKPIKSITPDAKGVTIEGKILDEAKAVESKGKTFYEITIGDASGQVILSCKEDQIEGLKKDKVVIVRNANAKMMSGYIRLVVDKWGKYDLSSESEIEKVGEENISKKEYELVKG